MVVGDGPLLLRTLELAFGSRADSTWQQYLPRIMAFRDWCLPRGYAVLPAQPLHVAMWLTELAEQAKSFGPVKMGSAAVAAYHEATGQAVRPTDDPIVKSVRQGAKRALGLAPVNRKEPLELALCTQVVHTLVQSGWAWGCMLATYMMVSFAGFLRYDDASSILRRDVRVHATHVEIFLARRKNDQFREGSVVVLTRGSSAACPVRLLERWLALAVGMGMGDFLFQAFDARSTAAVPTLSGVQLSYPQARHHVLARLALQLGITHKEASHRFGLHSLRSGGATLAAMEGVEERLFQAHGGWRSKEAMHAYLQESLQHLLAPTAAMGY